MCQISDDCFAVPSGYRKLNQLGGRGMIDEEEELLQLAIRQSLLEQSGGGGRVSMFSPASKIVGLGHIFIRIIIAGAA